MSGGSGRSIPPGWPAEAARLRCNHPRPLPRWGCSRGPRRRGMGGGAVFGCPRGIAPFVWLFRTRFKNEAALVTFQALRERSSGPPTHQATCVCPGDFDDPSVLLRQGGWTRVQGAPHAVPPTVQTTPTDGSGRSHCCWLAWACWVGPGLASSLGTGSRRHTHKLRARVPAPWRSWT